MQPPSDRVIDPAITVLPGTDVDDVWDRFEVFEALHHSMQICNPLSSTQLDDVIDAAEFSDGNRVLDSACGYGEVLLRAAARAAIVGTGVDLSPWMITRAHGLAQQRDPQADLSWVLGEARDFRTDPAPDVCVCIGAEWVWHDFGGTARALSERLAAGGVAIIGAARLHTGADQAQVQSTHGRVESIRDMHDQLRRHGFTPRHRVDPTDADWDRYLVATFEAAQTWAEMYPGPRAEEWLVEQADWQRARDRDREVIGWSVWIAERDR